MFLIQPSTASLTAEQNIRRQEALSLLENGPWSKSLNVTFVITNKCNLRCSHCFVKEWLTNETEPEYAFEDMLEWANSIARYKGLEQAKHACLIGGEAIIVPERLERCVRLLAADGWRITLVSNLTRLPDNFEFLQLVDRIQVSIDGLRDDHDAQRGKGTFAATYRNLRKLCVAGLKPIVQASVDASYTPKKKRDFAEAMIYAGVEPSKISIGITTTGYDDRCIKRDKLPIDNTMLSPRPCCEYRVMSNFTITPNGEVFASYHGIGRPEHQLGTISDTPQKIEVAFRDMVSRLVWVNDPKCLDCPALKRCWGMMCFQIFKYENTPKPSDYCQQERMIELNKEWISKNGDTIPDVKGSDPIVCL